MRGKDKVDRALAIVQKYHPEVFQVKDADHSIYVEVDGRLARGAKPQPDDCPLARAACAEMELDGALVSRGVIYLIKNGVAERFVPANATRHALETFDKGKTFVSGVYKFIAPNASQTLKQLRKRPKGPGTNKRSPRVWLKEGVRRRLNA
jgi:hypothetical protein